MTTTSLESLIIEETKETIYEYGLGIAQALGLPVTAWQAGDPSRALFHLESEVLSSLESVVAGYIRAGFLDYAAELAASAPSDPAAGMWLKILAEQVYGVDVPGAVRATTDCTLTNAGGGLYDDIEIGSITARNSSTGKTYRNTNAEILEPGGEISLTFEADEAGSESSAGVGEIDELVTEMLGVSITNPYAAVGVDEQAPSVTVQQCRDKLDSLSPNGAKGAYSYVARNSDLTGINTVTRVRVYPDSDTGDVLIYLAGPSGAVSEDDRAAVEEAILEWATPLCITPTVVSASNMTVPITYSLWIYKSVNKTAAEIAEEVEAALEEMLAGREIGGDIVPPDSTGKLYTSLIESTIRSLYPQAFRVSVSVPTTDTSLANGEVAALGTVTATINLVVDP